MGFIGEAIGSITRPILGKPSADAQNSAQQAATQAASQAAASQAAASQAAEEQVKFAREVWGQATPVRNPVLDRLSTFMQHGLDPTTSAMYAPLKNQTEIAYNTGRDNLMSQVANGGALYEGLAGLEQSKASTMGGLMAQILQDEYNKAYGIATGAPQQTQSGLLGAGQTYASAMNNNTASGLVSALANQQLAGNNILSSLMSLRSR